MRFWILFVYNWKHGFGGETWQDVSRPIDPEHHFLLRIKGVEDWTCTQDSLDCIIGTFVRCSPSRFPQFHSTPHDIFRDCQKVGKWPGWKFRKREGRKRSCSRTLGTLMGVIFCFRTPLAQQPELAINVLRSIQGSLPLYFGSFDSANVAGLAKGGEHWQSTRLGACRVDGQSVVSVITFRNGKCF